MAALKQICISLAIFLFIFSSGIECKKVKCLFDGTLVKCSTVSNPVCGYFTKGKCTSRYFELDATNPCTACANKGVLFYEEGPCTGKKVYCDALVRNELCTKEYFPVCAYSKDGKKTAGNRCMACADYEVDYYVVGECK